MPKKRPIPFIQKHKTLIRISYGVFLCLFSVSSVAALFVIETKESAFDLALLQNETHTVESLVAAFPIGVNPKQKTITEKTEVDAFLEVQLGGATKNTSKVGWFGERALAFLSELSWYQNLASPISRILVIRPGERKEEVVESFGDILRWDTRERETFTTLITDSAPLLDDGKFFPGKYVVSKDATPETVAQLVQTEFNANVELRYPSEIENIVPLSDALTIASLLEREAYDFEDMRYISGIIWNRLFTDMNLQLDASLQYAKATPYSESWWPVPRPEDKSIVSPYNTYKNEGLPPSPIANPSLEAILAALNPKKTDCMFYFHDTKGGFHCSKTYEEHVALLKQIYGRGK